MSASVVLVVVISVLVFLIICGSPIFISLGFSGLVGLFFTSGTRTLFQLPSSMFTQLDSFVLVAIPLFVFMGELIFISGTGSDIYSMLSSWLNRLPGGLAIASIFACAIFGAMCGLTIVGVATIGVVAYPEMTGRGYEKSLAAGAITASGALAALIPPSVTFILYGAMSGVSVAKLFIGGIIPGLGLAMMMSIYVLIRVLINPSLAPLEFKHVTWKERFSHLAKSLPAFVLIFLVLGSIYLGIVTPTESAAIGVGGAFVLTQLYGRLNWKTFIAALSRTIRVTGAILIILACAFTFSQFLNLMRVPESVSKLAIGLGLSGIGIILIIMGFLILLGMFIDGASMIIVTTPILLPTVEALGFSPVWYGILLIITIEIAVITPPVGLNLYTFKSIAEDVSLGQVLKGTLPYVIVEICCLLLFLFIPKLALWLPDLM